MIATGGLLRYNARRQDSLRSKPKPKPKKSRKKRRQEVVIVRGRIQLCSVSGLVAVLGLFVLLVGGVLAAVGYCPQELLLRERPEGGAANSSAPAQLELSLNSTNATFSLIHRLLHRFLDSDRLKVLGPLVMGVGIFLFLCANAVLHENRDKKTKVIKLQDIYSTVIDLHHNRDHSRDQAGALTQTTDQSPDHTRDRDPSPDRVQRNHGNADRSRPEPWKRQNGDIANVGDGGPQDAPLRSKWPTRTGGSVRETGEGGAYTRWWRRKGGSVRERSDARSQLDEERPTLPSRRPRGGDELREGGAYTKWWRRKGGSVRERGLWEECERREGGACVRWWRSKGERSDKDDGRFLPDVALPLASADRNHGDERGGGARRPAVFSVFHEQRFVLSLPRGFSFHRAASDKRRGNGDREATNHSAASEREEAESVEQETVDTTLSAIGSRPSLSFSPIGSQRPLLMMSCSSLSPAHTAAAANQRRGSTLSHAPCMSSTNRRSSWI